MLPKTLWPWRERHSCSGLPCPCRAISTSTCSRSQCGCPPLTHRGDQIFLRSISAIQLVLAHVGGRLSRCELVFSPCNAAYCDDAACRQARCTPPCREIPPQASNCISIIHRCCDLLIVPHTICVVIQCLQGPHLHLEFGAELVRPHSTTTAAFLYITLPYVQRPRHLPASCCSRRSRRSPAACTCGEYACVK